MNLTHASQTRLIAIYSVIRKSLMTKYAEYRETPEGLNISPIRILHKYIVHCECACLEFFRLTY